VEKLYEYKTNHGISAVEEFVCQGKREFIEKYIKQAEIYDLIGGVVITGNINSGDEFIGVRKKRGCQKFRRILRERGAEFELLKDTFPPIREN
jgi:hypothetical protein